MILPGCPKGAEIRVHLPAPHMVDPEWAVELRYDGKEYLAAFKVYRPETLESLAAEIVFRDRYTEAFEKVFTWAGIKPLWEVNHANQS